MATSTDPRSSRKMWQYLVDRSLKDPRAEWALDQVIASAVLDYITDRIQDDEYASVIGRRVVKIAASVGIDFTD